MVVDDHVEAVGGQRVDNVQEARVHAVVGQKLVADAVRGARAASCWVLQAIQAMHLAAAPAVAEHSMQLKAIYGTIDRIFMSCSAPCFAST